MTERPHEGHAEGHNADLQQVLDTSIKELLSKYASCSYTDLCSALAEQTSYTLGDLCNRLKTIRPIFCRFEHDHLDSGLTQIDCQMRKTNAACGHMGLTTGDRYREHADGGYLGIDRQNAVGTMEEAITLLNAFGVSCVEEQRQLEAAARGLRTSDREAVGATPQQHELLADLEGAQVLYGDRIMDALASIMRKLTILIRRLASEAFPVRQDYAVIKGKKFNTMWGEFQ